MGGWRKRVSAAAATFALVMIGLVAGPAPAHAAPSGFSLEDLPFGGRDVVERLEASCALTEDVGADGSGDQNPLGHRLEPPIDTVRSRTAHRFP